MNSINDGITRLSNGSNLYQAIGQLLSRLDALTKVIDIVSEIHLYLTIAWYLSSGLMKAVKHVFDMDKKLVRLACTMKDAFSFACDTVDLPNKAARFEKSIGGLLRETIECCLFIGQYTDRGFAKRMLDLRSSGKIDEFERSLNGFKEEIDSCVNLHTAFVSARLSDHIDEIILRQRLNPSEIDTSNLTVCYPGTRTEVLEDIRAWTFFETKQNVLWLHGVPGSGKSTISMTIAENLRGLYRLGGLLVFKRGKSDPSSVIRTIAYKLALFDSTIASLVITETEKDKDIITASLVTQFDRLLFQPLSGAAKHLPGPILIVLDALDECGTSDVRRDLIRLFRQGLSKLPNTFRFLITSRREADIDNALSTQPETVHVMELDYTSTGSQRDVLSFLRSEIEMIVTERLGMEAADDWNLHEIIESLGQAAGGLFIFASTAGKMISNSDNPFNDLEELVSNTSAVAHFGLYELYTTVLRNSGIVWDNETSRSRFRNVLGLVLLSKIPVSSKTVDGILGFSPRETSLLVLSRLRSLVTYSRDAPVSLFHTSFFDYLMAPERVKDPWHIDISAQQQFIAARCFSVMRDLLHFNMCGLESSFVRNEDVPGLAERVERSIPAHLRYACSYWSDHFCDLPRSSYLINELCEFAHERLLFWFEALSLMGVFDRLASPALSDAAVWAESRDADLSSFLKEARRLAFAFAMPITQSTPHIYTSLIPLTRDESKVSSHHSKRMSNLVQVERYGVKQPSSCLKVLEGHSDTVSSVVVSSDGTRIASASWDKTVRLWHVASGEEVLTLRHSSAVRTVSLSPDGRRLVSGSNDKALRIWDAREGNLILGPLEWHTDEVNSVVYSPDGTRIASGSSDGTVIIWDALSGSVISGPFLIHSEPVWSIAFSGDGTQVATGSLDKTLRIWDAGTGELVLEPLIHPKPVLSVAFWPKFGRTAASCCRDRKVRIWDAENGNLISVLPRDVDRCVAFSPCGRRIASASFKKIDVWNAYSGAVASGPFRVDGDDVWCVAFTPDGQYIVSGHDNGMIHIWDTAHRQVDLQQTVGHESHVTSVAFSPCGRLIASGSIDATIIIWNARTGQAVIGPIHGHGRTNAVRSVAFSPDGSLLASGSDDRTIRIWDVQSGWSVAQPLEGHTGADMCVALSPDGTQIVSGSENETLPPGGTQIFSGLWDTTIRVRAVLNMAKHTFVPEPLRGHSGAVLLAALSPNVTLVTKPLHGHSGAINSVAFSPDGKWLVSGSGDTTIVIWDAKNWKSFSEPLRGHKKSVRSVGFSPDSMQIASGSEDSTIIVWDAETHQIIAGPFEGHTSGVRSVIFLSDGLHLCSGSDDCTIRLWSIESGQTVGEPICGCFKGVTSLALAPNGSQIASGTRSKTIRVWDVSAILQLAQKRPSTANHTSTSFNQETSDWILKKDGWILGGPDYQNLLFWIPLDLRETLCLAQNTAICADFSTKLGFADAPLGYRWTRCFVS